jgi:threonine 3-dehydrogenase
MYVDGIRVGHYEAFCRPDTRIPLMYMPDGIRALLELSEVARPRLRRSTYNIAAFSPTAQQIADSVTSAVPGARLSFRPDPMRQEILDSWPATIDDSAARRDWGWQADYELEAMTRDLVPKIRGLLASGSTLLAAPG